MDIGKINEEQIDKKLNGKVGAKFSDLMLVWNTRWAVNPKAPKLASHIVEAF